MKKISFTMNFFMGLLMSFSLSLVGSLSSKHFAIPTFLISFLCSFILSLIIGLLIPMKLISDKVCGKFRAKPHTIKERVISSVVSTLIFTPIMTIAMVYMNITMAGAAIDRQMEDRQTEAVAMVQQSETLEAEGAGLSGQPILMPENAEGHMEKPSFVRAIFPSLGISLLVGFFLCFFFQPLIFRGVMKHYKIPV